MCLVGGFNFITFATWFDVTTILADILLLDVLH